MSTVQASVSDMLVTVKSRELQRGMVAEMGGDRSRAATHFLAGAHLELVLADDYLHAGLEDMALRSRISAASCFWRAGRVDTGRLLLDELLRDFPSQVASIQEVIGELEHDYPVNGMTNGAP